MDMSSRDQVLLNDRFGSDSEVKAKLPHVRSSPGSGTSPWRIAAALVELRLVTHLPNLHALFPDPLHALGIHRPLCLIVCGVADGELQHCAEMLGDVITSATRGAAEGLDDTFDAEMRAVVLVDLFAPQRGPRISEVVDIETPRLIGLARRGALAARSLQTMRATTWPDHV
jgi:hypothetical protein